MPAHRPEDCDLLLAERINAGDLEGAIAFYEPGARFVAGPDHIIEGSDHGLADFGDYIDTVIDFAIGAR